MTTFTAVAARKRGTDHYYGETNGAHAETWDAQFRPLDNETRWFADREELEATLTDNGTFTAGMLEVEVVPCKVTVEMQQVL
jgi:hypothetical protein